jgi:hypothetical protein
MGVAQAVVYLIDHELETLVPFTSDSSGNRLAVEGTLHGRAFATGSIVQAAADAGRQRLLVPLLDGTERLGTLDLTVDGTAGTAGPEFELVAERFAHLIAQAIVTKSAYGDTIEQVRRSRPMDVSAELVRGLLPPLVFATDNLVISGLLEPCYSVGGDTFDYAVNDRTAHVAIFDAMGHGLAAAGDAAFAVSAYRAARRRGLHLAETYSELDRAIVNQPGERYLTALLATLDLDTGQFTWLSAGHPAPLLLREGRFVKTLEAEPRTPLGVPFDVDAGPVAQESLQPGDLVLLYTDGLPEARLPDGEFFGVDRLTEFIERQASSGHAAPETLRRLRHAVLAHQRGQLQDDATAVLLEWRRGTEQALLPSNV